MSLRVATLRTHLRERQFERVRQDLWIRSIESQSRECVRDCCRRQVLRSAQSERNEDGNFHTFCAGAGAVATLILPPLGWVTVPFVGLNSFLSWRAYWDVRYLQERVEERVETPRLEATREVVTPDELEHLPAS